MFDHIILTKFNLRSPNPDPRWTKIGTDEKGLPDDAWMDHRFDLFERFCYPSVMGQTCQEFTWIVLMDPDTGLQYRTRMARLMRYGNLVAAYLKHERTIAAGAQNEHLMMTRLDNDDALHEDFVKRLHAEFRGQEYQFLHFSNGLCWDDVRRLLYVRKLRSGPLLTLISREPRSVYEVNHRKATPVKELDTEPMWMIVCHATNKLNRASGHAIPGPAPYEELRGFNVHI